MLKKRISNYWFHVIPVLKKNLLTIIFFLLGITFCLIGILQGLISNFSISEDAELKLFVFIIIGFGILFILAGVTYTERKRMLSFKKIFLPLLSIISALLALFIVIFFGKDWQYPAEIVYALYIFGILGLITNFFIITLEKRIGVEEVFLDISRKIDLGRNVVDKLSFPSKLQMKMNLSELKEDLENYHFVCRTERENSNEKYNNLLVNLIQLADSCKILETQDEKNKKIANYLRDRIHEILRIEENIVLMDIQEGVTLFNPELHEYKDCVINPDKKNDTIVKVIKDGYIKGSDTIKRALVIIAKNP